MSFFRCCGCAAKYGNRSCIHCDGDGAIFREQFFQTTMEYETHRIDDFASRNGGTFWVKTHFLSRLGYVSKSLEESGKQSQTTIEK
jgi:hypothetical protein